MKHEWRKHEKILYIPKQIPELLTVPAQKFIMIKGIGNPNGEEFSAKIEVLYTLAYAIRMMPKQGHTPEGYFEYTVYPLEGIWGLTEEGQNSETLDKNELVYTIMIRQPDFVTNEVVEKAIDNVRKKKPNPLLTDVSFGLIEDGLSVQMLHVGTYDDEAETFEKMNEFIVNHHLTKVSLEHREIYLSDFRKVEPSKLKTVLRYKVKSLE